MYEHSEMASDYYCSWMTSNSLFPLFSSFISPITDEQFNAFHTVDRELYSQLIFNHGHEVGEAMQVVAFWLWLEKDGYCPMKLVVKILRDLPPHLIAQVANETVLCLRCIKNDYFLFSSGGGDISLLQNLMEEKSLSLQQLHENRKEVLSKITVIVNKICLRAFKDILQQFFGASLVVNRPNEASSSTSSKYSSYLPPVIDIPNYLNVNARVVPNLGYMGVPSFLPNNGGIGLNAIQGPSQLVKAPPNQMAVEPSNQMLLVGPQVGNSNFNPFNLWSQQDHHREVVNRELGGMMSRINISDHHEEEHQEVPPDDRTIFLTFSKGYPISENEVREFFTRIFGDFIEAIHMQEVPADEQALYARIVARSDSLIDRVVPRDGKAKFSINGKHVWARKYVKKTTRSPP